jgi:hypothetical protein
MVEENLSSEEVLRKQKFRYTGIYRPISSTVCIRWQEVFGMYVREQLKYM